MFGIGLQELVVILIICLVIFGAKKLPEMAKALGKSMQEFKKACKETHDEISADSTEKKSSEDKS